MSLALKQPADYIRIGEISAEIKANEAALQGHEISRQASGAATAQLDRICEALENLTGDFTEWDDSLVRQLIHTVKVLGKDKILITFRAGAEVEENLY